MDVILFGPDKQKIEQGKTSSKELHVKLVAFTETDNVEAYLVSGYYEAEREVKSQIQAHGLQGQGMVERMWYMQEAIEVMGIVQFLHSLPKGKAIWTSAYEHFNDTHLHMVVSGVTSGGHDTEECWSKENSGIQVESSLQTHLCKLMENFDHPYRVGFLP
eukprot:Em0002g916a